VHTKIISRRRIRRLGGLSVAAAALATAASTAASALHYAGDVAILNLVLGLEDKAIAAYDAGARSKLLSPDQLRLAVSFQGDHKRHREILIEYIRYFGGMPVVPRSVYDFGTIGSATDIVQLAQKLEQGAEAAYLANAYKLESPEVINAAVTILQDETRHNAVFNQLLNGDVTEVLNY
jgi:hypothetical protein